MTILSSGTTYPLTIPAGNALVTIDLSGTSTVTGVTREDASRWHGTGAKACNPVSTATAITISTTGKVDYRLVAGDATPSSESFKYNPVTFDSTPADSAAVAAALGGCIIGETLGTEAGLLAAMAAVHAAGGGVVKLKYQTYLLTATLPSYANVTLEGAGWVPLYENIPDSGGTQYSEGTRLLATGNFPIYQYNSGTYDPITHTNTGDLSQSAATALYGPGPAGQKAFSDTAITQSVFRNLCLDGGGVAKYGMIAGSQFRASFFYCDPADNVLFVNFTADPFRFENFIHINMPKCRVFNCGSIGALGASSSGTGNNYLMPGNSDFNDLLGTVPSSNNLSSRGLIIYARNNTIHNLIKLVRVQVSRFNPTNYSESLTLVSGTADVNVTDLSKYTEELPYVFSTGSYGLPDVVNNVGGTLYVLSRSGTSGAGTVRFSWRPGIASALFTPTGSGVVTARTYGFPCIEATAYDTSQIMQFTIGPGSDVESGGTAQVQFSGCSDFYCDIKTPNTVSAYTPNIVALHSPQGEIRGNSFPTIYLNKTNGGMTASGQVRVFGTRGQATGVLGLGMWKLTSGAFQINLNPSADAAHSTASIPTLKQDDSGKWLPQARGYIGTSLRNRFTGNQTLQWNYHVGLVTMDGAAAVATLPVVDANSSGTPIVIYFAQAGSLASQSGQAFVGMSGTTIACPAGTFISAYALENNGTYSWGIASNNSSLGLGSYATDAAASAGGVPVGMTYVNSVTGAVNRRLV